jgi:phospholipase/carboxylesterase
MRDVTIGGPTVEWRGAVDVDAPLVVLLHGWGEDESSMSDLVPSLPVGLAYASVRAPYVEGKHCSWFAPGRFFDETVAWFHQWLVSVASSKRAVVLVGFSAGAAFGGGALLLDPERYVGAAVLFGTLPFEAGLEMPPGRLSGKEVFIAQSTDDPMIPSPLLERAWNYLTEESGARAHALRDKGGHTISRSILHELAIWISAVTLH